MTSTIATARLAIATNQQQITRLLRHEPIDQLALQELYAANVRELAKIQTALRLSTAAPHYPLRAGVQEILNQHFPALAR